MKTNTCCFIGHRAISETEQLKLQLCKIIEKLIVEKMLTHFFSGAKADLIVFVLKS